MKTNAIGSTPGANKIDGTAFMLREDFIYSEC